MNPYGEDDDDFDMNWLVDRNLQVGYCIVEDVGQYPPTPVKDIHWYTIYNHILYLYKKNFKN